MKTKLALAITAALALSACDDYELSSEGDNFHSVGTVAIVGDTIDEETLTVTITDNDGFAEEGVTYTWYKDNTPFPEQTTATYLLSDDDIGSYFAVKVEYVDNAGYNEIAISEDTDVVEEIAIPSPGSVAIDGASDDGLVYVNLELSAKITDENGTGANEIFYTWMADGLAIEDADKSKYTLTEDELGKAITVQVKYIDNKGFEEGYEGDEIISDPTPLVIEEPADIVKSKVVTITDTDESDEGELRIKLKDLDIKDADGATIESLMTGKLMVTFRKAGDPTNLTANDDTDMKDAYIGIFGNTANNGYDLTELRIKEGLDNGSYTIRDRDDADDADSYIAVSSTYTEDDWVKVEMTWDATTITATTGPKITMSIDGAAVNGDGWNRLPSDKSDHFDTLAAGLQVIKMRMGDSSATIDAVLYIDDLKIYSDVAGTELFYENDFESEDYLPLPFDLEGVFSNSTNEAVITEVEIAQEGGEDSGEDSGDDGDDENNLKAATISDNTATDAGELRYKDTSLFIKKGKLVTSFYKESFTIGQEPGDDSTKSEKDAYITIYGTDSSTNKNAFIDLRIHGAAYDANGDSVDYGTFEVRNGTGLENGETVKDSSDASAVDIQEGIHFSLDEWHTVELTWDTTTGASAVPMTFSLDGADPVAFDSASAITASQADDGVQILVFKLGDNGTVIADKVFQVDDIKLYDLESDTPEVAVFEDDFEGYGSVTDLDLVTDSNGSVVYNTGSTADAVVADRE